MPLSKDAIRNQHRERICDTYVSPHHTDGGWHGSDPANDSRWMPRNDHILVMRLPDIHPHKSLITPDFYYIIEQHRGIVIRVGPGKWVEGVNGGLVRRPVELVPGCEVIIGPHVDWESNDGRFVLCQEADVRLIVSRTPNRKGEAHGDIVGVSQAARPVQ